MPETVIPQPPIPPIPPTAPATPVINQPVSHGKLFRPLVALATVLLISGLAFGAYQLGKNQASSPTPNPGPDTTAPIVEPPIVSPTDPTADWKTYTNQRQNFQIKYPSEWVASENLLERQVDGKKQDMVTIDRGGQTPRIEVDSNNQLGLSDQTVRGKTFSGKMIANLDTFISKNYDEGGGELTSYYFFKSGMLFVISTTYYPEDPKETILLLDQILATFKFLDQNGNNTTESGRCAPKFTVEKGPELTASEAYSARCYEQKLKESCERVDIYSARSETYGDSDGIFDCQWVTQ